jgi:two-component system response regulator CpxR
MSRIPILIVDDDKSLCALLSDRLEAEGFHLTAAHDGRRGLESAATGAFALVILDVMLPGLGGLEVLKALRAASTVPVLMLTARGDDVDRIIGLEYGADDYLAKPFNTRELVARIKAVLRRLDERRAGPRRLSAGRSQRRSRVAGSMDRHPILAAHHPRVRDPRGVCAECRAAF